MSLGGLLGQQFLAWWGKEDPASHGGIADIPVSLSLEVLEDYMPSVLV